MGWSSWSFLRFGIDTPTDRGRGQGDGQHRPGRTTATTTSTSTTTGTSVPGPQGPDVDQYGRWVIDSSEFPSAGSLNGIAARGRLRASPRPEVRDLRDGRHLQAGGGAEHADPRHPLHRRPDRHATSRRPTTTAAAWSIDYTQPGAQAYVNSVVDELAGWGVDYIKLDGITDKNAADIQAWSNAISPVGPHDGARHHRGPVQHASSPRRSTSTPTSGSSRRTSRSTGPTRARPHGCNAAPYTGCLSVFPFTSYCVVVRPLQRGGQVAALRRPRRLQRLRLDRGRRRRGSAAACRCRPSRAS